MHYYVITWLVLWLFKASFNWAVYYDQGREELENTPENRWDSGLAEWVLVTFKFWWTSTEMRQDPRLKTGMIAANVTNVLFFGGTIFFVTIWIIALLKRRQELMGLIIDF
jgi:hypothetical protein